MATLDSYLTHVGLTVTIEQDGEAFGTYITGERKKPLYEGKDRDEAQAVFDAVQEHYEQRKYAAENGKDEREVGLIRTAGPTWKQEWAKQKAEIDKKLERNQKA